MQPVVFLSSNWTDRCRNLIILFFVLKKSNDRVKKHRDKLKSLNIAKKTSKKHENLKRDAKNYWKKGSRKNCNLSLSFPLFFQLWHFNNFKLKAL